MIPRVLQCFFRQKEIPTPPITGSLHNKYEYIHCVKNNNRKRWVYCASLDGYIGTMEKYSENAQVLLGQRIRYLRKLKKWTLEELGEKAATNHKHIGEIERGQQNPSYAVLVKISDALEVELPELFRFETEELSRKEVEREIARIVKSVPEEDLRQVLSVLRMIYPVR